MAEESDLERTEPASSRRLEQAREEGNVPQSRELMAFMVLAAGAGAFWILGGWLSQRSSNLVRHGLSFSRETAFDTSLMTGWALSLTTEAFVLAAPVFRQVKGHPSDEAPRFVDLRKYRTGVARGGDAS